MQNSKKEEEKKERKKMCLIIYIITNIQIYLLIFDDVKFYV